jgi:hypothetical protein
MKNLFLKRRFLIVAKVECFIPALLAISTSLKKGYAIIFDKTILSLVERLINPELVKVILFQS